MLTEAALHKLHRELQACIDSFGFHVNFLGQPAIVEKSAKEAEMTFQGYAKAKPNRDDAYAAARDFLKGVEIDDWKRDLIASVLAEPIPAAANELVLASSKFEMLLEKYEKEVKAGDLWRLTWHGLLTSYFSFNPVDANAKAVNGWTQLRGFLERTWPQMSLQSGDAVVPDWISVLRVDGAVLTINPAEKYASQYLNGNMEQVVRLKADLGIPQSSWFWHQLVLSAVRSATKLGDLEFKRSIPRLIELIRERPAFRDEAIAAVLTRYHDCAHAERHDELREFVVHKDVWRSPKIKASGLAPSWNRVSDEVFQMVMLWVTERALKDFFDILATRNNSDAGRLAFWSDYLEQIKWTRLVFGSETMALQHSNKAVRELIARERDDYAELLANKKSDAFMMQIGSYIAVEFSVSPNAAYVYDIKKLRFDRNAKHYNGGTDDLKYGFFNGEGLRILHTAGWQHTAAQELKALGIYPDATNSNQSTANGASSLRLVDTPVQGLPKKGPVSSPSNLHNADTAKFSMHKLKAFVGGFADAVVVDERHMTFGRLWVEDGMQSRLLATELEKLDFVWAGSRQAWYYRGD